MAVSTQTSRIFTPGTEPYDSPIQDCPNCGTRVDVTRFEPLQLVTCPGCNRNFAVKGSIDRFKLESIAGQGGTGMVYQAYDPHLGRKVALKAVRPDKATNDEVLQQMAAEAGVTASINHPHVVRVYSVGNANGRFFMAMEIIGGGSLDDLMEKRGRLPEDQVLDVAIQVASGLQAAQHVGLVHRDIKPGNILFADAKTAKVVDFGLSVFEQHAAGSNEVWGTPYYMPPERLQGQSEDFRADIYALGATLFHALAGRPPFDAADPAQVALKRLNVAAPSVLTYAPNTTNSTAFVLKKMLERNPDDRFQSYDELIESLQFARNELGTKPAAKARVVVDSESQGRSGMMVTVASLGVLLVGCIGGYIFFAKSKPATPPVADTTAADETKTATNAKPANPDAPAPGMYYLVNRGSGRVLDCNGMGMDNGTPIVTFRKSPSALNQRWIIRTNPDGTSRLIVFHTYKAVDVRNSSTDDNAAITSWKPNNTGAQRWRFRQIEPGFFTLFSETSKKALTEITGGPDGGGAVAQRDYSGAKEQQWSLEMIAPIPPEVDVMDPVLVPKRPTAPHVSARSLSGTPSPRFVLLDLEGVAVADSRKGLFGDPNDMRASVQPQLRGLVDVAGVPFNIIDPNKHPRGKDQIAFKGGTGLSKSYPMKYEIGVDNVPLSRLHFVGGHAGWGWPWGGGDDRLGAIAVKVTVWFVGGQTQEIYLRNGLEFSDHVTGPDLPSASLIQGFASGNNQLRYFSKGIVDKGAVEKITMEGYDSFMSPAMCALTAEKR